MYHTACSPLPPGMLSFTHWLALLSNSDPTAPEAIKADRVLSAAYNKAVSASAAKVTIWKLFRTMSPFAGLINFSHVACPSH